MADNKYYTPTIEEFYVGFEFEYYCEEGNLLSKDNTICEFRNQSFDSDWANIMFDEYEHEDKEYIQSHYKVKYLDKADIEELGFISDNFENYKGGHYSKFSQVYTLFGETKSRIYGLTLFTGNLVNSTYIRIDGAFSPGAVYGHLGSPLFKGIVKNKSELKVLLKQLGINE